MGVAKQEQCIGHSKEYVQNRLSECMARCDGAHDSSAGSQAKKGDTKTQKPHVADGKRAPGKAEVQCATYGTSRECSASVHSEQQQPMEATCITVMGYWSQRETSPATDKTMHTVTLSQGLPAHSRPNQRSVRVQGIASCCNRHNADNAACASAGWQVGLEAVNVAG